jgi:hypothetical protein
MSKEYTREDVLELLREHRKILHKVFKAVSCGQGAVLIPHDLIPRAIELTGGDLSQFLTYKSITNDHENIIIKF